MTDSTKKGLDRFANLGEATIKKIGETTKSIQNGVKPPPSVGGKDAEKKAMTLDTMVKSILTLIEKIEPKLPQQVLA
jgi:hypothetical protein